MKMKDLRCEMTFLKIVLSKVTTVCALAALMAAASTTLAAQTTARANRITQELSANTVSSVKIAGSVHPWTRRANDLGLVNGDKALQSLTLNTGLTTAQKSELDTLLVAQQNPKSGQYHKWLTQEEYGARFGLTQADLAAITSWLKGQGLTVKSVAPSRNQITFSGTVARVESAFRTQIHQYELNGEVHIANSTDIMIPKSLSGVVNNVGGLNSFRPKPHGVIKKPNPDFTSKYSGSHFLTPGDWATIYNVNSIYTTATGTGMHVGIVGQTYFSQSDVDKFRAAAGLPATNLTYVCISSADCTSTNGTSVSDEGEAHLDVEWAGGIAKDATVDYVYAAGNDKNQGVYEALVYAVTSYKVGGEVLPVISMSYGNCETDLIGTTSGATAYRQMMEGYFSQAAAQGQTILNSSGDAGAAGCDQSSTLGNSGAIADWPASSPLVVAVGGTTFSGDGSDTYADQYWSGSSSADTISSALQYIPETSWNDTAADQTKDSTATLSSSGGGVSQIYSLPSWQSDYTGAGKRYVPDVSFAASADHDGYLVCTQLYSSSATSASQTQGPTCVNGFRYSSSDPNTNNGLTVFGGTSAGSPSFAGLLTLLVQKYGNLGALNPALYSLASNPTTYASAFHDITTGTNKQPCTTGTGCTGGSVGYSAGTGYDLVTGLGSINGGALDTSYAATVAATTTTVTASSSSATIGDTITLTANVSSATSGTIGGTVVFSVGGTSLGSATISGGTATLSNVSVSTANGFSVGTDTITATYSGDTNYARSSSTASLTVAGVPTYTISAATTATTISAASSGTVALTLTSVNGYAGTVSFTTSVSPASNVTATVPSVTLTSGGTASATVTLTTTASAAAHPPATPWKSGGAILFCTVLLGAPLTLRRKRIIAVLLTATAITLIGFAMACGGGGSSSSSNSNQKTARSYVVTITPTGSGTVTNPSAITLTVTVP